MSSNKLCDLYAEFEPDANEIMFGQTTLPDRPLTDKEKSKRKKVLLKLLDQKLKFELIELMRRQQNQTNAQYESTIPTTNQININDSNVVHTSNPTFSSNYQSIQASHQSHPSLETVHGNWHHFKNHQFETPLQPSITYQQYETNRIIPWSNQNYGFHHNIQTSRSYSGRIEKPRMNPNLIEPNMNWVTPLTESTENFKTSQSSIECKSGKVALESIHTSTKNALNEGRTKPTSKETSSSLSVNQSIQQSSTKDLITSVIQIDLTKDEESLPSELELPDASKIRSIKMNQEFQSLEPLGSNKPYLQPTKHSIRQDLIVIPSSSDSNEVQQSTHLTVIGNTSSPVFKSNNLAQQQTRKRKLASLSNEGSRKKCLTVEQKPEMDAKIGTSCKVKANDVAGSMYGIDYKRNKKANVKCSTLTARRTDSEIKLDTVGQNSGTAQKKASLKGHQINSRNSLTEWNMMNQLITIICRHELHHIEPISPHQQKVKNEILIQMSINPEGIRSNTIIAQKMGGCKLEKFINECKIILSNVNRAGPETQSAFSELRDNLIKNMKAGVSQRDTTNEVQNLRLAKNKIANIICPFLSSENTEQNLFAKIIKNPYILENDEMIKSQMAAKNQSIYDVLKDIKEVLDSLIKARAPKHFFMPYNRYFDVPFAVKLYQKSGEMTELYANELREIIFDSINCLRVSPKPKIRDVKFSDGSLMMVCVNQKTFDWLEGTISDQLRVEILSVKNVISKNELKTVCMKFIDPQYFHFNNLMEQLKADNQRLLTRRWELRSPQFVDSTKCMYVGVDAESLVVLEEMNCEAKLRGSLVFFVISYDESENNFERMTFVKPKRKCKSSIKTAVV